MYILNLISHSCVIRCVYKVIDKIPPNAFVSRHHYTRILSMTFFLHLNCKSVLQEETNVLREAYKNKSGQTIKAEYEK